jgi:hypothetical protein
LTPPRRRSRVMSRAGHHHARTVRVHGAGPDATSSASPFPVLRPSQGLAHLPGLPAAVLLPARGGKRGTRLWTSGRAAPGRLARHRGQGGFV